MGQTRAKRLWWLAAGVLAAALLTFASSGAIVKAALGWAAGRFSGTSVAIGSAHVGWSSARLSDIVVSSMKGEPIARIAHIDLTYDLKDAIAGKQRAYGLKTIDIIAPQVTIVRRRNGSFNIPVPKLGGTKKPGAAPLIVRGRIVDGTVTAVNQAWPESAPALRVDHVAVTFAWNSAARSRYDAHMIYREAGANYPISGKGDLNVPAGYEVQRWHVPPMPVARLADFAVGNRNLHIAAGRISGAELRIAALPDASGAMVTTVSGATAILGGVITSSALARPLRDMHGRLDLSSQGAIFERLDGVLAGIPIHAVGGIFDFTHPTLHLALRAHGLLQDVRTVVAQASRLPMSGEIGVQALVEGSLASPLVLASLRAPSVRYLRAPVRDVRALVAVRTSGLDVIDGSASYAAFRIDAHGHIGFSDAPNAIALVAHASAPADTVPYAADLVPGMPLDGTLVATASNPKLIDTRGVLAGRNATQRLAAVFAVRSDGVGSVGPVLITGSRGRLYARASLDHPHGVHAAFLRARDFTIAATRTPPLPGFSLPVLPPLRGTLDATALGALVHGRALAMGSGRLALPLGVADTFDPPANARGRVTAPFALLADGNRAIVQVNGARFHDGSVYGIALQDAGATVALRPGDVHVFSAYVRVRGGEALARGIADRTNGVALSATGLHALGGTVSAGALLHGTLRAPAIASTVLAEGLRYHHLAVSGVASLRLANTTLTIADASLGVGPAFVALNGVARGIVPGRAMHPTYGFQARIRALDAAQMVALVEPAKASLVTGSIDADLRVRGQGTSAQVRGTFAMPEGSVNGLSFSDVHGSLGGRPSAIAVRNGGMDVGSTAVAFDGSTSSGGGFDVTASAPSANLADFNDFFAAGDMLAGTGRFRATLAYAPSHIASSGSAVFSSVRYARLPLGSVDAQWSSRGNAVALGASAAGPDGRLRLRASVDPISRAIDATVALQRLNLAQWMPAFGVSEPVTGYLDANATAAGRFPDVDSSVNAGVTGGRIGTLVLERATLALHTTGGRGRIDAANLQVPGATANLSGTFGFHPGDALALTLDANSPDIGSLYAEMTGTKSAFTGALQTTATLRGTRAQPSVTASTTLRNLRYRTFDVPFAQAQVVADSHRIDVRQLQINLSHGRLLANAVLPLSVSPLGVPRAAPFTASLTAADVELSDAASMLPQGSELAGRIDGTVDARGDVDDPQLTGLLTLAGLSYASPQLRTPITGGAQLAFAGQQVDLQNALLHVGDGSVVATGAASVPSIRDLQRVALTARVTARDATLDLPQYYNGRIDGSVAIAKVPGGPLTLGGTTTLSSARIPLNAFLGASSKNATKRAPLNVAFDGLTIAAGNDVRVQSSNVDVGAQGSLTLNGTLAQLAPSGSFLSTGGTISFYRTFTVERASVAFSSQGGIVPDVNAVATTYVPDPSTEIRLHVTGPATNMNLGLASQPGYDRAQILGLLVGAQQFGAVQGVAATGGGGFSATGAVTSLAAGQLNTLFTRNLLEPLSGALQSTLGFANVQLTSNLAQGQYGASVVKAFGHSLHAIFAQSFGYPQRSSFTLEANPNAGTSIRADLYSQPDISLFPLSRPPSQLPTGETGAAELMLLQPMSGTNGVDLQYVRRFW